MENTPILLTQEQIFKRAGGRRRYNKQRQDAAAKRRDEVLRRLDRYGRDRRGTQARIARELGVSRATICRDAAGYLYMLRKFGFSAADLRDLRALDLIVL